MANNYYGQGNRRDGNRSSGGYSGSQRYGSGDRSYNNNKSKEEAERKSIPYKKLTADETETNYVTQADAVMQGIRDYHKQKNRGFAKVVTTSKIRNLLAMTADIYNDAVNCKKDTLPSALVEKILYLKVRFVYEAGRDQGVKELIEEAHILKHLEDIRTNRQQFIYFSRYMEALVAYRKFYCGDN